jgi:hypothetical protein
MHGQSWEGVSALRQPNAIDFWRGLALITIFINHVPGNALERFTYSHYSIADAAELFVFLAGWSLTLATQRQGLPEPGQQVVLRLASRAVAVYGVQIIIVVIALAMIAAAALYLDNPLLLDWHNASAFFENPVQTVIGLSLLTYQLGYFNILPLYVCLLVLAPIFILAARRSLWAALILSFSLYSTALAFEVNLPNWPTGGQWFFNPLAWQFLLVLGMVSAGWAHESEAFRNWARRLLPFGVAGVALGVAVSVFDLKPDPFKVPEPRLFFLLDKSNLSPGRLLDFLATVLAFQSLYPFIARHFPWLTYPLSGLGRHSLEVFAIGSILALAAQLIRVALERSILLDLTLISSGLLGLLFTTWFVEWRSRSPKPSLREPS